MIILDTTVLVYAVGTHHPFRQPSRSLVEAVREGVVRATTTVEVIQEFAHVRSRRRGRPDARRLALAYADLLGPLRSASDGNLRAGLELWTRHKKLGAFDAVLAAVAQEAGVTTVVSSDRAFSSVPGLRHVLPNEAGVSRLLG